MRCNGSNWAVYSPGSWDGFRNDVWALWAGVIMRLEHHLVGGYVRYISPHIIIIIIITSAFMPEFEFPHWFGTFIISVYPISLGDNTIPFVFDSISRTVSNYRDIGQIGERYIHVPMVIISEAIMHEWKQNNRNTIENRDISWMNKIVIAQA